MDLQIAYLRIGDKEYRWNSNQIAFLGRRVQETT